MLVFTANNIIILMSVAVPVNEIVCYIVHAITNAEVRGPRPPLKKVGLTPPPLPMPQFLAAGEWSRLPVVHLSDNSNLSEY